MMVDASAIVAILTGEHDAQDLADRLAAEGDRLTSAIAVFEAVLALCRVRAHSVPEAKSIVDRFLEISDMRLVPIGEEECDLALAAFDHYGKGRHPAALNLGDCFAYAVAKSHGTRLLYKGDDFARTDIA